MRIILLLIIFLQSTLGFGQLDLVQKGELATIEDQLNQALINLGFANEGREGYDPFDALVHLGDLYRSKRNYDRAIEYYNQSLAYSHPFSDGGQHYMIMNKRARVLFANAQYEEAIEAFEESRYLGMIGRLFAEQLENDDLKARAWIQVGELEEAQEIFIEMHEIALSESVGDTIQAIESLAKAAEVSNELGQYRNTLEILSPVDSLLLSCGTDPVVDVYLQRALAYNKLGKSKDALKTLLAAEEAGLVYDARVLKEIVQIYGNLGKYKDALKYNTKAVERAKLQGDLALQIELLANQSGLQTLTGNWKGSIASLKSREVLVDKLRTKEILDESKRLRIGDYMVNVENQFRQRSLTAELEESDRREAELRKEAERLEKERERLEKEKNANELALFKEKEKVTAAALKAAEYESENRRKEAELLKQQNINLTKQRELVRLEDQRLKDSLEATRKELEQQKEIEAYEIQEQKNAFEAQEKEASLKRNRLVAIVLGIGLLIAGGLWFNTRRLNKRLATQNVKIEEQRLQVEKERERAEQLLLNVLPKSIAEELKLNGVAAPEKYESASVLFTDFVGFTSISSQLAPEEIIEELNECFTEFDRIAQRHRLEKIKTIGDSYMCAGGIPDANTSHPMDAVKAGQEMVEYMNQRNAQHHKDGKVVWPIRVGIHTGELVAGVVGSAKFAYDIWGDTVNVASRMERGAEHDSINISEETYQLIKEHFDCTFRGEIDVKNKGLMGMYRVG